MYIPMFRDLRSDEIECRIGRAKQNGVSLLLYKDARCDQAILDETVGPMNWQRHHSRDNANCIVSIWDDVKCQWIEKEDTGTESNTEKEKGLASDSFKRACVNWGIGRELYTAPFIWINSRCCTKLQETNGRWKCTDDFYVSKIGIKEKRIIELEIRNRSTENICFTWPSDTSNNPDKYLSPPPEPQDPPVLCPKCGRVVEPKKRNGELISPQTFINELGSCYDCYKASKAQQEASND